MEETQSWTEVELFRAYGRPISTVSPLKYLGRVLMVADYNWAAVI